MVNDDWERVTEYYTENGGRPVVERVYLRRNTHLVHVERMRCGMCGGTGKVWHGVGQYAMHVECGTCGGEGTVVVWPPFGQTTVP